MRAIIVCGGISNLSALLASLSASGAIVETVVVDDTQEVLPPPPKIIEKFRLKDLMHLARIEVPENWCREPAIIAVPPVVVRRENPRVSRMTEQPFQWEFG